MKLFRPRKVVNDPSGTEWEIYVTKASASSDPWLPNIYSRNTRIFDDDPQPGLLALLALVIGSSLVGLSRLFCSYMRGRRSSHVRVEALTIYPRQEARYWTTTTSQLESVISEIASGLEQGRIAQPNGAEYLGSRQS